MDPELTAYIEQYQPESLLECSCSPWLELEQVSKTWQIPFYAISPQDIIHKSQTTDLAIVHNALEAVNLDVGQQLLGHLRNNLAKCIWLTITDDAKWPLPALLALGFKRDTASPLAQTGIRAYTYDLRSYNRRRSWNNPRFWANPENFNKYRW